MPGHRVSCASPEQSTAHRSWPQRRARAGAAGAWQREAQPGGGETEAVVRPWRQLVRAGPSWPRILPQLGLWLPRSEKGSDLRTQS